MPQKKLLIVESDPNLASQLENGLNDSFEILIALSGSDGLKSAKENKPEIIVLDFILPKMNGFQLTTELKKDPSFTQTKLFLLTDNEEVGKKFVDQFKISGYFTKPYKPDVIVNSIKKNLGVSSTLKKPELEPELTVTPEEDSLEFLEQIFSEVSSDETMEPTSETIPFLEEKPEKEEVTEVLDLDDDSNNVPVDKEATIIEPASVSSKPTPGISEEESDDDDFDSGLEEFNPEDLGVLDEIFSEVDELLPDESSTPAPVKKAPASVPSQPEPVKEEVHATEPEKGKETETEPSLEPELIPEPELLSEEELESVGDLTDIET